MPAYKDNTTKTWYVRFYYKNHLGELKQKKKRGFAKKTDALNYEREYLLKLDGSPELTFETLYHDYMADMKVRLRETTYIGKEYMYQSKILPYFKHRRITDITVKDVRQWQNELLKHKNKQGKPFSPTYVKTINNQLSAVFNYAVKYYNLPFNPARRAGSIGKKQAEDVDFWTLDEFNQAMTFYTHFDPYYFIFHLLFYSGMRLGELQALSPIDFNYADKTVSITKSYSRINKKDIVSEPKTPKSKRTITIPKFLFDMLDQYLAKLHDYSDNQRIFFQHKASVLYYIKKAAKFTNTKIIRVHDLRHSHASHLIDLGYSPLLIQERLGHEDVQTTLNTYSHLYPNKQRDIADELEQFKPKTSPKE